MSNEHLNLSFLALSFYVILSQGVSNIFLSNIDMWLVNIDKNDAV